MLNYSSLYKLIEANIPDLSVVIFNKKQSRIYEHKRYVKDLINLVQMAFCQQSIL